MDPLRRIPVWLLAGMLLVGCAEARGPQPAVPTVDRVDEIRAARATVARPAAALGDASLALRDAVAEARFETAAPEARRRTVAAIRAETLAQLRGAIAEARSTEVEGSVDDVAAARAALAGAADHAEETADAAVVELRQIETLADAEDELAEIVAVWDQPGSRREQLDRFEAAAVQADALAERLESRDPVPACASGPARRASAAETVAQHTRELRELIAAYRGREFDERRAELRANPYGLGEDTTLHTLDQTDRSCWDDESAVATGPERVSEDLEVLEEALNPADLQVPGPADE